MLDWLFTELFWGIKRVDLLILLPAFIFSFLPYMLRGIYKIYVRGEEEPNDNIKRDFHDYM